MPINPPITTSNIPDGWNAHPFVVKLETNEPATTYYTLDGSDPFTSPTQILYTQPFLISVNGETPVTFVSQGLSGVLNLNQTKIVKIDTVAPVAVISTDIAPDGANDWYKTLPQITLSATDLTSGVGDIFFSWDDEPYATYSTPLTIPSPGSHFLKFFARDIATNAGTLRTVNFKFDPDAPTTYANVPLETATLAPTITFMTADDASGVDKTYYTIDGTTPTTLSSSQVPFTISQSGTYTIKFFSVDKAGNHEDVKTSPEFVVDVPDLSGLNLTFAESFPMNGNSGWYRSSPFIGITVDKPQLTEALYYKVSLRSSPTTAKFTSAVDLSSGIDLYGRSLIAIEVDQSGTSIEIDVGGVNVRQTTVADIVSAINIALGDEQDVAFETGADGNEGTGYVTVKSPTSGNGSLTSEIKFTAPSKNDGTLAVFGLSTTYPHTFTETVLFESFTVPFILPSDGVWDVSIKALDVNGLMSEVFTKEYRIDSSPPVTIATLPSPNVNGFYTSQTQVIFEASDQVSGAHKTYYQFDNDDIELYIGLPVYVPAISGLRRLRYYSIDVAGNVEPLQEITLNYDEVKPLTTIDVAATNYGQPNILELAYAPNIILDFNPQTNDFALPAPGDILDVSYQYGWDNDLNTFIYDPLNVDPSIIVNNEIRIHLRPVDDVEIVVVEEAITSMSALQHRISVANGFIKNVSQIYNATQSKHLSAQYFSDKNIYVVPTLADPTPFNDGDLILVSYAYTKIAATYYTTDGSIPTTSSPQGHIIELDQAGSYTLKFFSIDHAGNAEDVQTFPVTIIVINRAPIISLVIPPANGSNGWHTSTPLMTISMSSPIAYALNQLAYAGDDTFTINLPGQGRIDYDLDYIDQVNGVGVTHAKNITTGEVYTVVNAVLNPDNSLTVDLAGTTAPTPTDEVRLDYTFKTKLLNTGYAFGGCYLLMQDPLNSLFDTIDIDPDVVTNIGMNHQGIIDVSVVANDARGLSSTVSAVTRLDSNDPTSTYEITDPNGDPISGYVTTDVLVKIVSSDANPGSGAYRIYYTIDGSTPTVSSVFIPAGNGTITLTDTGTYNVKFFSMDFAGNMSPVYSVATIQIDKTPPESSVVVSPPDGDNGWYVNSPVFSILSVDADSGAGDIYYAWESDPFVLYTGSFIMPGSGIKTLKYYGVDVMGNVEAVKEAVFKFDGDVPSTSDDISGVWTNNKTVNFTVTDIASPTFKIYYTTDGTVPTLSSPFTTNQQIIVPVSGVYTIKYFAVDEAGNQESPKTAANQLLLDLEAPTVDDLTPTTLVFTPSDTELSITLGDPLSGVDAASIRVVIDDIEYSATYNSSLFSISGPSSSIVVNVGPVSSIPAFDIVEKIVVYATDIAGNKMKPAVFSPVSSDATAPYVRGTWPKHGANDVSRDTSVSVFIDDEGFGIDIRTFSMSIAGVKYSVVSENAISVTYDGLLSGTYISIANYYLTIFEGGVAINEISFRDPSYGTVKKVADAINATPNFSASALSGLDQESSTDIVGMFRIPLDSARELPIIRGAENKNINYFPKGNGLMITVTPNERFDDDFEVEVKVDISDFYENAMPTEVFSFTVHEENTPSRDIRSRWNRTHLSIIDRIRSNMESTYNKRTDSTEFHGYLKALSLEIARALQTTDDYRDDVYYDGGTTRPELLFQNLGYLLKFEPRPNWTHEKYRRTLLAILKIYLEGSKPESIAEAVSLFLDIDDIPVHEAINQGLDISHQFEFTLNIDLNQLSESVVDMAQADFDLQGFIRQIRPAHAMFLLKYFFNEFFNLSGNTADDFRFNLVQTLSEDMRSSCEGLHDSPVEFSEEVSHQFDGINTCFKVTSGPILNSAGTAVSFDPSDVTLLVTVLDGSIPDPISIVSMNGETGDICLSRAPQSDEDVFITYTHNPYMTYRNVTFKLNTYAISAGEFDLTQGFLLNQPTKGDPIRGPVPPGHNDIVWSADAYNIVRTYEYELTSPETPHAHFCEDLVNIHLTENIVEVFPKAEPVEGFMYLNSYVPGDTDHTTRIIGDTRWVLWGGFAIITPPFSMSFQNLEIDSAQMSNTLDNLTALAASFSEDQVRIDSDGVIHVTLEDNYGDVSDILKNHNFFETNSLSDITNSLAAPIIEPSANTEVLIVKDSLNNIIPVEWEPEFSAPRNQQDTNTGEN